MKKADLINVIAVAVLSAMIVLGTFGSGTQEPDYVQEKWLLDAGLAFGVELEVEDFAAYQYDSRDLLLVWPGTQLTVNWQEERQHLDVQLKKGSVLYATQAGDFTASVDTGFAEVHSAQSTAFVSKIADDQVDVYALEHPSWVDLKQGELVYNSMPVSTNSRVKVHEMRVNGSLSGMNAMELSLAFPSFDLEEGDLPDVLRTQLVRVDTVYASETLQTLAELQAETRLGPPEEGLGMSLFSAVRQFKDAFTVTDHAQLRLDRSYEDRLLSFASTNLLYGSEERGVYWAKEWSGLQHDADAINALKADLFFVLPGDELYPVREQVLNASAEEDLEKVYREYREVEDLMAVASEVALQEAYESYKNDLETLVGSQRFVGEDGLEELSHAYLLLTKLLVQDPALYTADNFEILETVEAEIMALTQGDSELDVARQNFVQERLLLLETLFALVTDSQVEIKDATPLAENLLFSAEAYLTAIETEPGIEAYFASQIDRYDLAAQFMNSAEFYTYDSFDEGLLAFEQKVADLDDLNEYIQNTRAGSVDEQPSAPALEEAVLEVGEVLTLSGVQYTQLVSLDDNENRLFRVEGARTGGYFFDANYDRETQIFYDVVVEDVRFSTGLLASEIRDVIAGVMQVPDDPTQDDVLVVGEDSPLTETVAINFAVSLFQEAGVDTEFFTFTVIDVQENRFAFEGAVQEGQIPVVGVFDANTGFLEDLRWGPQEATEALPDMPLSEFNATMEALLG